MKEIADEIRAIVKSSIDLLNSMQQDRVSVKPSPGHWSKKEILGHLIDSVANNHHRIVRGASGSAVHFPSYNQNEWVQIQQYDKSEWDNLVALWNAYNLHLSHLIEHLPEETISNLCNIGKEEPVTIEFVAKDYLRHLQHHLKAILKQ